MNIIGLIIENVRRIRTAKVTLPPSGIVQITGANESGKSTFVNAIKWALVGKSGVPEHVVTEGEKNGRVVLTVGENGKAVYNVEVRFYKSGDSKLTVTAADGSGISSQQALLNTFWNDVSIQPLRFANASPKEQRELLLRAMALPVRDEFVALTGVSGDDVPDPIAALDAARRKAFDERTDVNREVKRLSAQLVPFADVPDGLRTVDTAELIAERDMLRAEEQRALNAQAEMKRIEERMEALSNELTQLSERHSVLSAEVMAVDMEEISDRCDAIDAQLRNASIAAKSEEKARIAAELDRASDEAKRLDGIIKSIDEEKRWMVENATLPMPQLSFGDDGEVLYEGEPLEARGISRRILIGCAIAKALRPELNVVLIDEGSELDAETVTVLSQWAHAHGVLVVMAREQATDGTVTFTIHDGKVVEE